MGEGIITECESPPWPRWVLVALTLLGVFKGIPRYRQIDDACFVVKNVKALSVYLKVRTIDLCYGMHRH